MREADSAIEAQDAYGCRTVAQNQIKQEAVRCPAGRAPRTSSLPSGQALGLQKQSVKEDLTERGSLPGLRFADRQEASRTAGVSQAAQSFLVLLNLSRQVLVTLAKLPRFAGIMAAGFAEPFDIKSRQEAKAGASEQAGGASSGRSRPQNRQSDCRIRLQTDAGPKEHQIRNHAGNQPGCRPERKGCQKNHHKQQKRQDRLQRWRADTRQKKQSQHRNYNKGQYQTSWWVLMALCCSCGRDDPSEQPPGF